MQVENKHSITKIPISMALAYFELEKKENSTQTNECSRKFVQYLSKFKKTSSFDYASQLQKYFNGVVQQHEGIQKDLIQIWNLDLRSVQDIQHLFPKFSKKLTGEELEGIVRELQSKNK